MLEGPLTWLGHYLRETNSDRQDFTHPTFIRRPSMVKKRLDAAGGSIWVLPSVFIDSASRRRLSTQAYLRSKKVYVGSGAYELSLQQPRYISFSEPAQFA